MNNVGFYFMGEILYCLNNYPPETFTRVFITDRLHHVADKLMHIVNTMVDPDKADMSNRDEMLLMGDLLDSVNKLLELELVVDSLANTVDRIAGNVETK